MVDVFSGRTLLNKDGDSVDPEEALRNKVVGLYFSAGWCPPCRDFMPILCDFYTELVEENDPPAQFEIVFISSDKTAEDMVEYMPDLHGDWLALPMICTETGWRCHGVIRTGSKCTLSYLTFRKRLIQVWKYSAVEIRFNGQL
ncbi:UNVERIFIED_CONTAM: hypothetical protein FKN15_075811 [Acipenser sinensis]